MSAGSAYGVAAYGAWGPLLREYRKRVGMSVIQAAAAVKLAAGSIGVYERGYQRPSQASAESFARAYQCTAEETAALVATLGAHAQRETHVQAPVAVHSDEPQEWHTRLERLARFAKAMTSAGLTEGDAIELLTFLGTGAPQGRDTVTDPTLAYVSQALDEFGAPPPDIEQLRRAVHRVVDQWLDWTRKRLGSRLVEISGTEEGD